MRGSSELRSVERQQAVLDLLRRLDGLDPLKRLFWSELNYDQVNRPISRRDWPRAAREALTEDPILLAGRGDFHVIHGRLHSSGRLHLTDERAVVTRLLREHPYALFLLSDSEETSWHFVNVKYDASAEQKPEKRRLFRRITVGPDERLRTAAERIALLDLEAISPTLFGLSPLDIQKRHDEAFDVEAVTQAFFGDYAKVFRALQADLTRQTEDAEWAHDYALQFLNRIMFLYFVQRKRWLADDPHFIGCFWNAYRNSGEKPDSFFPRWLSVLFFEAFNNRFSSKRYFSQELNDALQLAPYLNGGLFERNELDQRHRFQISDAAFEQAFAFFEQYNFTIAEDSPLDQEVAVDPEMIGRVYESLVSVHESDDEGGQWGIFYTPRTEIDLMCRLALVDNLANHLGDQHRPLLYEVVFALEAEEKREADEKVARENLWPALDHHLGEITVLDPACGSGSFLVGMLRVLADLRERADDALGRGPRDAQYRYELKKEIVGQSLYGVDVMEWAVRVAELRLWLQLIVDAELDQALRKLRPLLPNLSFQLRPGDSLVQEVGGVDLSHVHGRTALSREIKGRLTRLKAEKLRYYRNERGPGVWTREQIAHEERRLFGDMLDGRARGLQEEAKRLEHRIDHPERQAGLDLPGVPEGKATQLELRVAEWQEQLEQAQAELAEVEQARAALRQAKEVPFVWDVAFVEVFEGEERGFDIVTGNPPYVRQERIAPPGMSEEDFGGDAWRELKKEYKAKLARSVYACYPRFFGYRAAKGTVARKLDAKNDLYVYFYLHGLSLLNPRGSFCFITSNSWLDVGYGRDLQEFLLRHGHVKLVLDNQLRRSFQRADINTVIVLLAAPDDRAERGLDRTARFVMCTVPFEHILSPVAFQEIEEAATRTTKPEYRVHPRRQRDLLDEALAPVKTDGAKAKRGKPAVRYESNKWGGKYLRAPDIYWRILEKAGDKLVRLGDIADVRFGIKTGANDFFYVRVLEVKDGVARVQAGDGSEHEIEEEFLRPVVQRVGELDRPRFSLEGLSRRLVMISRAREQLRGTSALRYIQWGERPHPHRGGGEESVGYHRWPSCAGRDPWFDLGDEKPVPLLLPMFHKRRPNLGINECAALSDQMLYEVTPTDSDVALTAGSLLSTFGLLDCEVWGRSLFGQGVLQIPGVDIKRLRVAKASAISPANRRRLTDALNTIASRRYLMLYDDVRQPDRIALDNAFLDAVGFSDPAERAEVVRELHDAACRMIWNRMAKTDNARESRMTYDEWLATGKPFGKVLEEEDE